MALSREEIQKRLVQRYQKEDATILKEVSYNLAIAGTKEENLEARAEKALQKLKKFPSLANEALSQSVQTLAHNKLSVCPICKVNMRPVKLLDDRDVYYCTQHRIIQPFPRGEAVDPKGDL